VSGEAVLWGWLRDRLPSGHYSRVESETSPGIPDVNFCVRGVEGWVELKSTAKTSGHPFRRRGDKGKGLRAAQIRWITGRVKEGGRVWILASVGQTLVLVHGRYADAFNDWSVEELIQHATWSSSRRAAVMSKLEVSLRS